MIWEIRMICEIIGGGGRNPIDSLTVIVLSLGFGYWYKGESWSLRSPMMIIRLRRWGTSKFCASNIRW